MEKKQTIAPMSKANFLLMGKKKQFSVLSDEALKKVDAALKVIEPGIKMLSACTYPYVFKIVSHNFDFNHISLLKKIHGYGCGFFYDQELSDDDYDRVNFEISIADQVKTTTIIVTLWFNFCFTYGLCLLLDHYSCCCGFAIVVAMLVHLLLVVSSNWCWVVYSTMLELSGI